MRGLVVRIHGYFTELREILFQHYREFLWQTTNVDPQNVQKILGTMDDIHITIEQTSKLQSYEILSKCNKHSFKQLQ